MPSRYSAFLIISWINLALFACLIRILVWRCFPKTPLLLEIALLVMYGFCNLFSYLQCRPYVYEIAIGFATTATLACFLFLFCALEWNSRRCLWLTLASLSAGTAFASRHFDILLLVPLLMTWYHLVGRSCLFQRKQLLPCLGQTLATFLPVIICLLAMAWYNATRFGNPLEFGFRYQLGLNLEVPPIKAAYLVNGLWSYFLTPWHLVDGFPFINTDPWMELPGSWPKPGEENHVGILTAFPILLLGFAWPFYLWKNKNLTDQKALGLWGLMLSAWGCSIILMICMWSFVTFRYAVEMQMPLLLLTSLTLLLCCHLRSFPRWQIVMQVLLFSFSCYMGFALGLIGHGHWIDSMPGLTAQMNFQERIGRLHAAEAYGKKSLVLYGDSSSLVDFYRRHWNEDISYPEKYNALFKQIFPRGLRHVTAASFSGPPTAGVKFELNGPLLTQNGLNNSQIIVAVDGYVVENAEQYRFARNLSSSPHMQIITWDGQTYRTLSINQPTRQFGINLLDYP